MPPAHWPGVCVRSSKASTPCPGCEECCDRLVGDPSNSQRKKAIASFAAQRYGYNGVFLRNDVGRNEFPEVQARDCFNHPFATWAYDELRPLVMDKEWFEV